MTKFNWLRWFLYFTITILGLGVLKIVVTKITAPAGYLLAIITICLQTLFILGFLYYALFAVLLRKRLNRGQFLAAFLSSFVCLLVLFEIVFIRWLYHPASIPAGLQWSYKYYYDMYNFRIMQYEKEVIAFDEKLLYTLRPGATIDFSNAEFNTQVAINKVACRDNDSSATAPEIICLGDSFTMGWGLDQPQSFPELIEKETGMKTLNAGTPSYGTVRELLMLERLDTSKVRYVIIQYCFNDREENGSFIANNYKLGLTPLPVFKKAMRTYELSRKYFPGKNFLLIGNLWMKQQLNRIYPFFKLSGQPYNEEFDARAHASDFLKVVMQFHERFKQAKLIVVNVDIFKYRDNQFIDELQRQSEQTGDSRAKDLILVNSMNGLTVEDYFILDYHINASGHRKVAARLVEAIRKNP